MYGIGLLLQPMLHEWTGRPFTSIGRGDVTKLLDKIEEKSGTRQANYSLAIFSSMANWYAAREDDYRSPVVKGMRRGTPTKRDRISMTMSCELCGRQPKQMARSAHSFGCSC